MPDHENVSLGRNRRTLRVMRQRAVPNESGSELTHPHSQEVEYLLAVVWLEQPREVVETAVGKLALRRAIVAFRNPRRGGAADSAPAWGPAGAPDLREGDRATLLGDQHADEVADTPFVILGVDRCGAFTACQLREAPGG
jgi:hypothetical protein